MRKSNLLVKGLLSLAVCFLLLGVMSSNAYAIWGCGDNCAGDCTTKVPVVAGGGGCNGGTCNGAGLYYCEDRDQGECGCAPSQFVDENGNDAWECTCQ